MIYLDHAAATPMDPVVFDAMRPYFVDKFYNPSALYMAAKDVGRDLRTAREKVGACIGARPVEIVFTAGGSEANNLAISGLMHKFPGANVVVSAVEHDSVLKTAQTYDCRIAAVTNQGIVDLSSLERSIDEHTVLVSIMYANNEVGAVQPIKEIAALVASMRTQRTAAGSKVPLYLHTDAAQAGNYLDIHVSRLGVDLMTLNGGKVYGPKQSGALYVKSGVQLDALIHGGGQEQGLRSGTENVGASIGFAEALYRAQQMRREETFRLQRLQKQCVELMQAKIPRIVINGSMRKRLPNNIHITIPGQDNERLLFMLDERGIQAVAGSACSASDETSSHVLLGMGLSDAEARASLRFTMGRTTTQKDIETTVETLSSILA